MKDRVQQLSAIALPLLGIVGGIMAVFYPLGYRAFCTGFQGIVV